MTREEAKKLLPVIQAFADGKEIQYVNSEGRVSDKETMFDDVSYAFRYRIKPEPTYRPFRNVEECWAEMQKHQPFGWIKNSYGHFEITGIKKEGVCFGVVNNFHGYEYLFTDYLFADGTPFGMKEDGTETE
jgi:hypothetical protein